MVTKRINIEMSWKKPQSYDVDIEAGAYYNGRWGGSKFRVIKNKNIDMKVKNIFAIIFC